MTYDNLIMTRNPFLSCLVIDALDGGQNTAISPPTNTTLIEGIF